MIWVITKRNSMDNYFCKASKLNRQYYALFNRFEILERERVNDVFQPNSQFRTSINQLKLSESPILIYNNQFGAMEVAQPTDNPDNHTIWMENAGFLYDRLFVHKLKWPSLTFQWLPFKQESPLETVYKCLYATQSSGNAQAEHIYIADVTFPNLRNLSEDPNDMPASRIKTVYRFTHENEVNRARYNPNDWSMLAARTDEGPICLFKEGNEFPVHLMDGNLSGGFALQWSNFGILSGDQKGKAFYWRDPEQQAECVEYGASVDDAKMVDNELAVVVGDSGYLCFWDLRSKGIAQKADISGSENRQVYSVSVNPAQNLLLLTGGQDQAVKIWDRRNLSIHLHKFEGHEDSVMAVEWSPLNCSMFVSGSSDKKVKIWDFMRTGFEIPKDLGGTDELLFTHEGHKGGINDLNWNPYEMIIGSTEEDENTLQFYQITNNIHELEYAEDLEYLREQCFS